MNGRYIREEEWLELLKQDETPIERALRNTGLNKNLYNDLQEIITNIKLERVGTSARFGEYVAIKSSERHITIRIPEWDDK